MYLTTNQKGVIIVLTPFRAYFIILKAFNILCGGKFMKKRKIIATALAMAMLAVAAPLGGALKNPLAVTVQASELAMGDFKIKDFEFEVYNYSHIELCGYTGSDSTVNIPKSVIIPAGTELEYYGEPLNMDTEMTIQYIACNAFPDTVTDLTVDNDNEYFSTKDGVLYSKDEKELIAVPGGKTSLNIAKTVDKITFFEDYDYHDTQSFDNLTTITVEDGNTTYKAVDNVLYSADGTYLWYYPASKTDAEFVIPEGVKIIDRGIFNDNLKSITLPSTFRELHADDYFNYSVQLSSPFMECPKLETITVSENNPYYTSIDGVLYSKDMSWLLVYPNQKKDKEYTIPSATFRFEGYGGPKWSYQYIDSPFSGNPNIEKINFLNPYFDQPPIAYPSILESRFASCDKLTTLAGYANSTTDECVKIVNETVESENLSDDYKLTFESLGEVPIVKDTTTDDETAKGFEVIGLPEKFKDYELKVDILESYEETENKRLTWDIYLVDADGKRVDTSELGATVTVKLPVPKGYWGSAVVYHVDNNGEKTLLPTMAEGEPGGASYIIYTTDHFSRFTAGNTAEDVPEKFDSISDPDTETPTPGGTEPPDKDNDNQQTDPDNTTPGTTGKDDTNTDKDNSTGTDQKGTGAGLAIAPVILACAAVAVASKKRK